MPGNSWGAARAAEKGSRPVIMDTRQTLHRVPLLLVAAFARLLHPLFSPTSFCGRLLPQRGSRRATNTWHQPQKQFGWLDFFLPQMNSSWMSKVSKTAKGAGGFSQETALEWKFLFLLQKTFFFLLWCFHFGCCCMYPAACLIFPAATPNIPFSGIGGKV